MQSSISNMKRKASITENSTPKRSKVSSNDPPAPEMSLLHAPVEKGWGKKEWTAWVNDEKSEWTKSYSGERSSERSQQLRNAIDWAAPDVIAVKFSTASSNENEEPLAGEVQIPKGGSDTWRSVIDQFCTANAVNRDGYEWSLDEHQNGTDIPNEVEIECFNKCFKRIWWPYGYISRFAEDGTTYAAKLTGRKIPPARPPPHPDELPSFPALKSLPPEGNAPRSAWKAWLREHRHCSSDEASRQKKRAIWYRCPSKVAISLKGMHHDLDLEEFDADTPLSVALASFCSSAPQREIIPADVLLKYGEVNDMELVNPRKTPRDGFNGTTTKFAFDVVYKDPERTTVELLEQRPIPDGYFQLSGAGYLLSEIEQPWLVTKEHGSKIYDQLAASIEAFDLWDDPRQRFDTWLIMTKDIIRILGNIVKNPKAGWTMDTAIVAMDKLTAALICLRRYVNTWGRNSRGLVLYGWFEKLEYEPEVKKIIRKMDFCASKVIKQTMALFNDASTRSNFQEVDGVFGIRDAFDQLLKLMLKFKKYPGVINSADAFPKSLQLVRMNQPLED